jgi:hypothetical protein
MIVIFIILGLIAFCVIGIVALGFFGMRFASRTVGPMVGCVTNFEFTREALLDYAKDHDGRLPKAETWQDDVKEYVRRRLKEMEDVPMMDFKSMKADGDWGCYVDETKMTGMAFNSDYSGKLLSEVESALTSPILFEIESPRRNASEKFKVRDPETAPKFMGQSRGWIKVPLRGEVDIEMKDGNWRTRTSSNSSEEPSSEETK